MPTRTADAARLGRIGHQRSQALPRRRRDALPDSRDHPLTWSRSSSLALVRACLRHLGKSANACDRYRLTLASAVLLHCWRIKRFAVSGLPASSGKPRIQRVGDKLVPSLARAVATKIDVGQFAYSL